MAFGLQVNRAVDGVNVYDTSTITFLQVDQYEVAANATDTRSYTFLEGFRVFVQQQMVGVPPDAQEAYAPEITAPSPAVVVPSGGATITVAPFSGQTSERVIITILVQGTGV